MDRYLEMPPRAEGGKAPGPLRSARFILVPIDNIISKLNRLSPLRKESLFRISYHPFRGKPMLIADGTAVANGEEVVEIHLNNGLVGRNAAHFWRLLSLARGELTFMAQNLDSGRARAVYGVTIHHALAARLGFETRPLPRTFHSSLVRFFLTWMLIAYHPRRERRLGQGRHPLEAREVWMSLAYLKQHYAAT